MKTLFTFLLLFFYQSTLLAQQINKKTKLYVVKAIYTDSNLQPTGIFYSFNDSMFFVTNTKKKSKIIEGNFEIIAVPANNIKSLKLKRKGKTGKFAIAGALAGATTGIIMGQSKGDDDCITSYPCYTAQEKATILSILLVIPGTIIGSIIGAPYTTLKIDGKVENIELYREELEKYSIEQYE